MENFKNGKSFGYRFAMLHRLQMGMCRQDILALGLQPSHLPFVISLSMETEPVSQEYLSCCLAIDKGSTARALGQLEKKGYVSRKTNPENRRQNLVTATPKAREASVRLKALLAETAEAFVRGFTREEKQQVLDLMDRMLSNAQNIIYPK